MELQTMVLEIVAGHSCGLQVGHVRMARSSHDVHVGQHKCTFEGKDYILDVRGGDMWLKRIK